MAGVQHRPGAEVSFRGPCWQPIGAGALPAAVFHFNTPTPKYIKARQQLKGNKEQFVTVGRIAAVAWNNEISFFFFLNRGQHFSKPQSSLVTPVLKGRQRYSHEFLR